MKLSRKNRKKNKNKNKSSKRKYSIIRKYIKKGGSKNSLILIIPIRNREQELRLLIPKMREIFKHQNIDYKVFIVEQSKKKKFNKGKINNIGFLESTNMYPHIDNILFNDVDNYPFNNDTINYNIITDRPIHFFGYDHCLGGIYLFPKKDYIKINGFSNRYYGWGKEDKDLQLRLKLNNIDINRDYLIERSYNDKVKLIADERPDISEKNKLWQNDEYINNIIYRNNSNNNIFYKNDGLNNIDYNILNFEQIDENIFRILVDL